MKVSYSPRAVAQITEAFEYIAQDNPAAADAFLLRVESIGSLLSGRPGIGRMTGKTGVQVVSLQPYRYLLFYKTLQEHNEIRIIRVRHMSRKDAADVRGLWCACSIFVLNALLTRRRDAGPWSPAPVCAPS